VNGSHGEDGTRGERAHGVGADGRRAVRLAVGGARTYRAKGPAPCGPPGGDTAPSGLLWYAAYGSNMHAERLTCYLAGGRPEGGSRTYAGCRDRTPPRASAAVELPGTLYFATESLVWTGGRAFYDPAAPGRLWGRAHLITTEQFADVAAQEMYREPGRDADLDLSEVLREGRAQMGGGRYETLVCAGALDGVPVLTFTAPWGVGDIGQNAPSATYLAHLAAGLVETGAGDAAAVATYLASRPGAAGHWTADAVMELMGAA
jgi:hypothetical protein